MSLQPVPFSKRQPNQPRLSKPRVVGRHAETHWRDDEDAILREYYPKYGVGTCLEKLPKRSTAGIYSRANALGLKSETKSGERKRRPHRPELDALIRETWPMLSEKGAVQAFADRIGEDRWVISKRATALGLTKTHRKEPPWTEAERAVMTRVPLHDPQRASEIFKEHGYHRTPTAIVVQAKRLGLSCRRSDVLSAGRAATILGVDDKWITSRCIEGRLPAEKRGTRRLVQQGGDTWSIKPDDFRSFIIANLDEIDIRKIEKFSFVALLTAAKAGES